jgi:hypothetical protein
MDEVKANVSSALSLGTTSMGHAFGNVNKAACQFAPHSSIHELVFGCTLGSKLNMMVFHLSLSFLLGVPS